MSDNEETRPKRYMYTDEDRLEILNRLSDGELLKDICKDEHMPSASTFMVWVSKDQDLAREYMRARKIRAINWCDDIVKIADDNEADSYIDDNGKQVWNYDHIQRSKLRIEARKWLVRADLPEIFSEENSMAKGSSKVDAPPQESREQWLKRQKGRAEELAQSLTIDGEGDGHSD